MRASKNTLQAFMISMVCGSCKSACLTPYVLITFLRDFNASPGLISSLLVILQAGLLSSLPGAVLLSNVNPKYCTIGCLVVARVPLFLIPALLLLPDTHPALPLITVLLCGFLGLAGSAAGGAANTWFKNAIPAPVLGRFLGNRNAANFLVMALVTPLVGYLLDHNALFGLSRTTLYTAIFTLAILLGLLDLYYLCRAGGGFTPARTPFPGLLRELKQVLSTRRFWRTPLFSLLPVLGIAILTPYLVLILYDFGLSRFQNGIVTALATLGVGAGAMLGGRLADRYRNAMGVFFSRSGFGIAGLHALTLGLLLLGGGHRISVELLFAGLLPLMIALSLLQGITLSLYTRLVMDAVPDSSRIAFGFLTFLLSALTLLVSSASSALGVWMIGATPRLRELLWPGFHYGYALFALAAVAGVAGGLLIRRLNGRPRTAAQPMAALAPLRLPA